MKKNTGGIYFVIIRNMREKTLRKKIGQRHRLIKIFEITKMVTEKLYFDLHVPINH